MYCNGLNLLTDHNACSKWRSAIMRIWEFHEIQWFKTSFIALVILLKQYHNSIIQKIKYRIHIRWFHLPTYNFSSVRIYFHSHILTVPIRFLSTFQEKTEMNLLHHYTEQFSFTHVLKPLLFHTVEFSHHLLVSFLARCNMAFTVTSLFNIINISSCPDTLV